MKNDTIMLVATLLVVAVGGRANAQPASSNKAASVVQQSAQQDSADEYLSHRGSGMVGINHPLPGTPTPVVSAVGPEEVAQSDSLRQEGEASLRAGDTKNAISAFQAALNYSPTDGLAYQRLAEAFMACGRLNEASQTFHKLLIEGFGPGIGNGVGGNPNVWAEYALVLARTGQPNEAVATYQYAASFLNFQDSDSNGGKAHLQVLLPEFGMAPGQILYTPEHLQAMAHVAIAIYIGTSDDKEAIAHLREAARLYPDSAVTQYYLGNRLLAMSDAKGAKAASDRAFSLGLNQLLAAAREVRKPVPSAAR